MGIVDLDKGSTSVLLVTWFQDVGSRPDADGSSHGLIVSENPTGRQLDNRWGKVPSDAETS